MKTLTALIGVLVLLLGSCLGALVQLAFKTDKLIKRIEEVTIEK